MESLRIHNLSKKMGGDVKLSNFVKGVDRGNISKE